MAYSQYTIRSSYLILGGARSGKSHYAEKLAIESGKEVVYIATTNVMDDEIAQRVARHKQDRPTEWATVEEPLGLAKSLENWASPERVVLVDCLTMWLTNLLSDTDKSLLNNEQDQLLTCLQDISGTIIFVSNEVSMGVIPMGELTRQFVDEVGRLHQRLAERVDNVTLMVAGLPHHLKS